MNYSHEELAEEIWTIIGISPWLPKGKLIQHVILHTGCGPYFIEEVMDLMLAEGRLHRMKDADGNWLYGDF